MVIRFDVLARNDVSTDKRTDTKVSENGLLNRPESLKSTECVVLLHLHYSQVNSDP